MTQISAIILAAGVSSRMEKNKLLLPWANGYTIVQTVVRTFQQVDVNPLFVVTGHSADAVRGLFHGDEEDVRFVHNPNYIQGEMLSSLKAGIRALDIDENEEVTAMFVMLGDLPKVRAETLEAIMEQASDEHICVPRFEGRSGHPILFPRRFWRELLSLPFDAMPKAVIEANPENIRWIDVPDSGILTDIDTDEDYQRERS